MTRKRNLRMISRTWRTNAAKTMIQTTLPSVYPEGAANTPVTISGASAYKASLYSGQDRAFRKGDSDQAWFCLSTNQVFNSRRGRKTSLRACRKTNYRSRYGFRYVLTSSTLCLELTKTTQISQKMTNPGADLGLT